MSEPNDPPDPHAEEWAEVENALHDAGFPAEADPAASIRELHWRMTEMERRRRARVLAQALLEQQAELSFPSTVVAAEEPPRKFDVMIGQLDRLLSEFMAAAAGELDEADRQTVKHHADDLIGVGRAVLDRVLADGTIVPRSELTKFLKDWIDEALTLRSEDNSRAYARGMLDMLDRLNARFHLVEPRKPKR